MNSLYRKYVSIDRIKDPKDPFGTKGVKLSVASMSSLILSE